MKPNPLTDLSAPAKSITHRAKTLLLGSELSVVEVAQQVGYAGPYYFMRVLKVGEGCSPLAYRSLFRGEGSAGAQE